MTKSGVPAAQIISQERADNRACDQQWQLLLGAARPPSLGGPRIASGSRASAGPLQPQTQQSQLPFRPSATVGPFQSAASFSRPAASAGPFQAAQTTSFPPAAAGTMFGGSANGAASQNASFGSSGASPGWQSGFGQGPQFGTGAQSSSRIVFGGGGNVDQRHGTNLSAPGPFQPMQGTAAAPAQGFAAPMGPAAGQQNPAMSVSNLGSIAATAGLGAVALPGNDQPTVESDPWRASSFSRGKIPEEAPPAIHCQ